MFLFILYILKLHLSKHLTLVHFTLYIFQWKSCLKEIFHYTFYFNNSQQGTSLIVFGHKLTYFVKQETKGKSFTQKREITSLPDKE